MTSDQASLDDALPGDDQVPDAQAPSGDQIPNEDNLSDGDPGHAGLQPDDGSVGTGEGTSEDQDSAPSSTAPSSPAATTRPPSDS